MDRKKLFLGFAAYVCIMFSIVLFADESIEKIEILDTENISKTDVELYRQNVPVSERRTHCQIGQLFLDGKHIEKNYDASFFHLFLCGKTYSWFRGGDSTYKQFIPAFKSDDIQQTLEVAKGKALAHAQNSDLSEYELDNVTSRIKRSYSKAIQAQTRVSTGMTYRGLIVFNLLLFILLVAFPPSFRRIFKS